MSIIIPSYHSAEAMTRNGEPGVMYMLDGRLSDADHRKYRRCKTVFTGTATYRYASEITYDYMWIADKARNVEFA